MPPGIVTPKRPVGKRRATKHATPARYKIENPCPNGRASCMYCGGKIEKGSIRVGVKDVNAFGAAQRYCHDECVPDDIRMKLPSPQQQAKELFVDHQRGDIRTDLTELRRMIAQKWNKEPFQILKNRTMDELARKLPTNRAELEGIRGMGPKTVETYAKPILKVIEQYRTNLIVEDEDIAVVSDGPELSIPQIVQRWWIEQHGE